MRKKDRIRFAELERQLLDAKLQTVQRRKPQAERVVVVGEIPEQVEQAEPEWEPAPLLTHTPSGGIRVVWDSETSPISATAFLAYVKDEIEQHDEEILAVIKRRPFANERPGARTRSNK